MKILHVIRKTNDVYAFDMVQRQRQAAENEVAVLLLQDAVLTPPADEAGLFVCRDDATARGVKPRGEMVGYDDIVRMLLEYDSVVSW